MTNRKAERIKRAMENDMGKTPDFFICEASRKARRDRREAYIVCGLFAVSPLAFLGLAFALDALERLI